MDAPDGYQAVIDEFLKKGWSEYRAEYTGTKQYPLRWSLFMSDFPAAVGTVVFRGLTDSKASPLTNAVVRQSVEVRLGGFLKRREFRMEMGL